MGLFENKEWERTDESYEDMLEHITDLQGRLMPLRRQSEIIRGVSHSEGEQYLALMHKKAECERGLVMLENDIRIMQENCFKGMAVAEESGLSVSFKLGDMPEVVVDHGASAVVRKPEKEKKYSENLVFSDVTFVVERAGKSFESVRRNHAAGNDRVGAPLRFAHHQ